MPFSLEVIRARKGDCLILHYGTKKDPHIVLIDGGPSNVYTPNLRPRLEAIRTARGLQDDQELPVDLLMVSHVDDDHIHGILELTRELITAEASHETPLLRIAGLWHNSFENLIGHKPKELTAALGTLFGAASTEGELDPDATLDDVGGGIHEETVRSNLMVLASIKQGAQLRADADGLGIEPNPDFGGHLIIAGAAGKPTPMGDGLTFTVVGPAKSAVKALQKKHQDWLKELKKKGLTPEDALAAYVDKSVTNLSSLVVLAESGGRRMLLTGDARGDKIIKGLERAGAMEKGGTIHVDLLKVPHHGSSNNVDEKFFRRITADHYVFSGDGEHGNPERETLEWLLAARGKAKYQVHLTYPVEEIDVARQKDWEKERTKERERQKNKPETEIRPHWSPAEHSLTALLAKHKAFAKKIKIVKQGEPHLIDLLD